MPDPEGGFRSTVTTKQCPGPNNSRQDARLRQLQRGGKMPPGDGILQMCSGSGYSSSHWAPEANGSERDVHRVQYDCPQFTTSNVILLIATLRSASHPTDHVESTFTASMMFHRGEELSVLDRHHLRSATLFVDYTCVLNRNVPPIQGKFCQEATGGQPPDQKQNKVPTYNKLNNKCKQHYFPFRFCPFFSPHRSVYDASAQYV